MIQEQLDPGHIVSSISPWNTPIFVIRKKSGKWRLLQHLREVNKSMVLMGATQPSLPTPVAIPKNWHLIVIVLKDCFFTIPLHPKDSPYFDFSVLSLNLMEPCKRYQWVVLPQGMANSPTICQIYVSLAIEPIRLKYPQLYIIHYMDDILLPAEQEAPLMDVLGDLQDSLQTANLQIAPKKIQKMFPYQYLGHQLLRNGVCPQKIILRLDSLHT